MKEYVLIFLMKLSSSIDVKNNSDIYILAGEFEYRIKKNARKTTAKSEYFTCFGHLITIV